MKTMKFFIVCLFLFVGLPQLYAQKGNSANSKSVRGWKECPYWTFVFMDGQYIGFLSGSVMVHYVSHFKNGSFITETDQIKGEVTSVSGEVFELKEVDKYNFAEGLNFTWRFNLIGERGTHYIGTLTFNMLTGMIIDERVVGD